MYLLEQVIMLVFVPICVDCRFLGKKQEKTIYHVSGGAPKCESVKDEVKMVKVEKN